MQNLLTHEHGHYLLVLAAFLALQQGIFGLLGAQKSWRSWQALSVNLAHLQFLSVSTSFLLLVSAFVTSDFSVALVSQHSHSTMPLLYKISATWGNHEGSMHLWVVILSLFGSMVAWGSRQMPLSTRARVLGVQALIGVAFYAFLILTSNPFVRLVQPTDDGFGLNPILQDPGIALHPPALYLGYVGLSVTFSFAIAALIEGKVDAAWARFVRPWTLLSWVFLTIGIALGSWWAYYELGWGGYWFWDPVENASFMPWLVSIALLHSAVVVEKRDTLKSWTILLAIVGFSFSLVGTFIVRSGLLTSVHSFAADPTRGVFILAIILAAIVIGFGLYAWRAPQLVPSGAFAPISRESGIVINNLLLCVATAVVFVGTMWPLVAEVAVGETLAVGPPFFDASFTPFMILLAFLLPLGATIPWKRAQFRHVRPIMIWVGAIALACALITLWRQGTIGLMAPLTVLLSAWVIFGSLADLHKIAKQSSGFSAYIKRLFKIPRSEWGKVCAHIGFGIVMLAVGILRAYEFEDLRAIRAPVTYPAASYEVTFEKTERGRGPNYIYERGHFVLTRGDRQFRLQPEIRNYPVEGTQTAEAAIVPYLFGDLYLVMRRGQDSGVWSVYFYIKPLSNLLWIGSAFMALGGLLSLTDRRMRLGIVARGRKI